MRILLSAQKNWGRTVAALLHVLNLLKCEMTLPDAAHSKLFLSSAIFFSPAALTLHPMETMSTNLKPAGKPIFDRTAHTTPQPVSPRVKADSLDAQAEQIRKAWLERATSRSK